MEVSAKPTVKFLFSVPSTVPYVGDDDYIVPSATDEGCTLSGRMWSSAPTGV